MTKRTAGLLLTAAAAYGAYRYSRMSAQQKSDLKAKGKDFLDKNLGSVKNLFSKKKATTNGSNY